MAEFIEKRFSELEVGDIFRLFPEHSTPLSEKIGQGYFVGVEHYRGHWPNEDFSVYVTHDSTKGKLHTCMRKPLLDVFPHPASFLHFLNIDLSESK
mgnify:FL=1